jgi:hypothetical protein
MFLLPFGGRAAGFDVKLSLGFYTCCFIQVNVWLRGVAGWTYALWLACVIETAERGNLDSTLEMIDKSVCGC